MVLESSSRPYGGVAIAILLSVTQVSGQYMDARLVGGTAGFGKHRRTMLPSGPTGSEGEDESFLNSLRTRVPGYAPIRVAAFRLVPLEKGCFFLVAVTGGERFYWNTDVVTPEGQGFRSPKINIQ